MAITFFDLFPDIRLGLKEKQRARMINGMLKHPPKTTFEKWENPKKIVDVKIENDGTVRTYIEGEKYPVRFYTLTQDVWAIALIKRLFSLMLGSAMGIIVLVLGRKIWSRWLQFAFEVKSLLLKDEHWSQPVKEIRRVLKGKLDDNFIDMISLLIQTDMAYCYRLQDIVGELRKDCFLKNPIKELKRLLDIYEQRELVQKNKNIIRKIKKCLWILRIVKLKDLMEIVSSLNVDEIKLSKEDAYWTNIQEGYEFRGISLAERRKLNGGI